MGFTDILLFSVWGVQLLSMLEYKDCCQLLLDWRLSMLWKVSVFKFPKPENFYFPIKKMNFCLINFGFEREENFLRFFNSVQIARHFGIPLVQVFS